MVRLNRNTGKSLTAWAALVATMLLGAAGGYAQVMGAAGAPPAPSAAAYSKAPPAGPSAAAPATPGEDGLIPLQSSERTTGI